MLSADGRCKSFGEGGDGYVPGEGVGAVSAEAAAQAIADGDQIYGVIRGSAINHGGKTNGYTVPNPQAQRSWCRRRLRKAESSARSVSYIEAHGTGTELGRSDRDRRADAGVRAGHAGEAVLRDRLGEVEHRAPGGAAGIAGLTKVLLQLKHRTLVPSLHAEELNPHIDFAGQPVRGAAGAVGRGSVRWSGADGMLRELPRIAGISSFGAGGANAHVVIEEYVAPARSRPACACVSAQHPAMIVLSAKNEERLKDAGRAIAVGDRAASAWRCGSCRRRLHAAGRPRGDGVPARR